jgi:hypothetical protein
VDSYSRSGITRSHIRSSSWVIANSGSVVSDTAFEWSSRILSFLTKATNCVIYVLRLERCLGCKRANSVSSLGGGGDGDGRRLIVPDPVSASVSFWISKM